MKPRYSIPIIFTLFFLIISSASWAGTLPTTKPENVDLSTERLNRLSAILKADVNQGKIPGAVALIARRGKVAYFESFGMRDKAKAAPMKKDTIFRIYSMTKPIVSVAVMMLQEEGPICPRDPISQFIPELGELKAGVEKYAKGTGHALMIELP